MADSETLFKMLAGLVDNKDERRHQQALSRDQSKRAVIQAETQKEIVKQQQVGWDKQRAAQERMQQEQLAARQQAQAQEQQFELERMDKAAAQLEEQTEAAHKRQVDLMISGAESRLAGLEKSYAISKELWKKQIDLQRALASYGKNEREVQQKQAALGTQLAERLAQWRGLEDTLGGIFQGAAERLGGGAYGHLSGLVTVAGSFLTFRGKEDITGQAGISRLIDEAQSVEEVSDLLSRAAAGEMQEGRPGLIGFPSVGAGAQFIRGLIDLEDLPEEERWGATRRAAKVMVAMASKMDTELQSPLLGSPVEWDEFMTFVDRTIDYAAAKDQGLSGPEIQALASRIREVAGEKGAVYGAMLGQLVRFAGAQADTFGQLSQDATVKVQTFDPETGGYVDQTLQIKDLAKQSNASKDDTVTVTRNLADTFERLEKLGIAANALGIESPAVMSELRNGLSRVLAQYASTSADPIPDFMRILEPLPEDLKNQLLGEALDRMEELQGLREEGRELGELAGELQLETAGEMGLADIVGERAALESELEFLRGQLEQ